MNTHYEFQASSSYDTDDQAFLFDVHEIDNKTGRKKWTREQVQAAIKAVRILAQSDAQRDMAAAQPSVTLPIEPLYRRRPYKAGP